jgi:crotonobetainyl-CoA:carnitine CoA-transferase CaiB-like acyl-CoA transferase
MERLGLGEAALRADNPGLVWCSVTAFGPGSELPGYDLLIQAVGGLMSVTGEPDGAPMKVGVALVDVIAGLYATVGILAALRERGRSGLGQRIDVSLFSAVLAALVNQASGYLGAGVVPGRMGNRHPSITPYQLFAVADGEVVVAVGNDRQFADLCRVLGGAALAGDDRYATNPARVAHREQLAADLAPLFARRGRAELEAALAQAGVPCGPVNDVGDAFALAQRLGLDSVIAMAGDARQVASPIGLDATPVRYGRPPPALGADAAELRAWLGAGDRA